MTKIIRQTKNIFLILLHLLTNCFLCNCSLSLYHEMKMLYSLSHILVI